MSENSKERIVTLVGIDLAKSSVHVHGVDAQGKAVFSKKLSRARLMIVPTLQRGNACRPLQRPVVKARQASIDGSQPTKPRVRLIAPQFVKPFVKTNIERCP